MSKITIDDIKLKKKDGKKITMLTAYDYPFAQIVDNCGIDIVLVGDSLANVVLGLKSTTEVNTDEMIHHTKSVRRGVKNALLVGDMPYESYQTDISQAVKNAKRFIDEAGCDAIKLEWFDKCLEVAAEIIKEGIPVMGHVGLTPQTAAQLGGFKVQGKDAGSARLIIENAKKLEDVGCFSIVLECVPAPLAKLITGELVIPTFGIGAGVDCDGQVLVIHDLLGLYGGKRPKFVKQYVDLNETISKAVRNFKQEVEDNQFPNDEYSYHMDENELRKLEK